MGDSQNTAKTVVLTLLLVAAAFPVKVFSRDLDWHNFTSFKDVRRMRVIEDTLFIASSGGILAVTDFSSIGRAYVNLDGLGTNSITDIIRDAAGQKWVTGLGRLVRFGGDNTRQFLFFDLDGELLPLYRVVDDGEMLWVGTEAGLVLFSKEIDDGQIQDSYIFFDDLNPTPIVYDILLSGDSIWLATSSGLAAADRTDKLLLKSPSNWTGYSIGDYPELGTDTIMSVVSFNSEIYLATRSRVLRLEMGPDTSFISLLIGNEVAVHALVAENDSLFVYFDDSAGSGIGSIEGDVVTRLNVAGLPWSPSAGAIFQGTRWVAATGGVFSEQDDVFVEYPYTGLLGNDISDITVGREGVITAGFRAIAVAQLIDSSWESFDLWVRGGTSMLRTDSSDYLWMGTVGNGLWLWDGETLTNYDENNSTLRGLPPSATNFVIPLDFATDGSVAYIASYRALNEYPVAVADLNNLDDITGWDSIGAGDGLANHYVVSLDLYQGQLAVANEFTGVYVCDVSGDPFSEDVNCQHFTRENSLLISNSARVVRYAPDGALWVGTNQGLSRYDSGIDRFVDVNLPAGISSDVTSMAFDGRGNLWVGTKDGLARRDALSGEIEIFNTLNSDLVANRVNSVTFDRFTGDIYISTTGGFSMVSSATGRPASDVNEVLAFPNPFVIQSEADRLTFNYDAPGTLRIFSAAGELILEGPVDDWDGKNSRGNEVASGVYIFVVTDSDGKVGKGKILLVRK
ncbi:MAG: hypothetical protein JSW34_04570 [Candidatus Zixiibacteriota bacterium]|nr:MAG: hypothetical protein JSW34_04570 [candidate division Zixibacteria bacterium]